jgi:hypothetical protein
MASSSSNDDALSVADDSSQFADVATKAEMTSRAEAEKS